MKSGLLFDLSPNYIRLYNEQLNDIPKNSVIKHEHVKQLGRFCVSTLTWIYSNCECVCPQHERLNIKVHFMSCGNKKLSMAKKQIRA